MLLCGLPLLPLLLLLLTATPQWGAMALAQPSDHRGSLSAPGPVVQGRPFTVVWNMPTSRCQKRHNVTIDLGAFDIVENHRQSFQGQNMSIFYRDRLGLYPYISGEDGTLVNGGFPQQGDLEAHLSLAQTQISALLRPSFSGLAVIDWEEWRPLWVRDFGMKTEYRRLSKSLVRRRHPKLPKEELVSLARREFEKAARGFMEETLRLGVGLHPAGLWGFYGFPACFNNHREGHSGGGSVDASVSGSSSGGISGSISSSGGYRGRCHPRTSEWNDRLAWLWRQSTALYPSIYLPKRLAGSPDAGTMVRHRLLEALRVASRFPSATHATPVMPYARLAFAHTLHFLTKTDLEHTLGESAALGASGVVLWGELKFARSKHQCEILRDYVDSVLGDYVRTLKSGLQRCSQERCQSNGRCARRDLHSDHLIPLFLSDPHHTHNPNHNHYHNHNPNSLPDPSHDDIITNLHTNFLCQCYQGWTGEQCQTATTETIASDSPH